MSNTIELTNENVSKIQVIAQTAQVVGINSLIIEEGLIRGIDDSSNVIFNHRENLNWPFKCLGLNRLSTFLSRLELVSTSSNMVVTMENSDDGEFVKAVNMKSKGMRAGYRAAKPSVIKAPRQIADRMKYALKMDATTAVTIAKACLAMGGTELLVSAVKETVKIEAIDTNQDSFTIELPEGAVSVIDGDSDVRFSHKYPSKIFLSLLKKNPEGFFNIGEAGMLSTKINGLDIYVMPQL